LSYYCGVKVAHRHAASSSVYSIVET